MKFIKVTLINNLEIKVALVNIEEIKSLTPHYTMVHLVHEKDECNGTVIVFRHDGQYLVEESMEDLYEEITAKLGTIDSGDLPKIGDLKEYKKDDKE